MTSRVTTPMTEGRPASASTGPAFTFPFAYLISAHCLAKPESPSKGKNTLLLPSPSTQRHDQLPSSQLPLPPRKNKGLLKVPPSTPWPGCSPCPGRDSLTPCPLAPPWPCTHRACQQLQSPAAARGRQKASAQHVSFCSLPGRKCTFYFNRGVNPPHLQLL